MTAKRGQRRPQRGCQPTCSTCWRALLLHRSALLAARPVNPMWRTCSWKLPWKPTWSLRVTPRQMPTCSRCNACLPWDQTMRWHSARQPQTMISRSSLFCCCARSKKDTVPDLLDFGVLQRFLPDVSQLWIEECISLVARPGEISPNMLSMVALPEDPVLCSTCRT